MRHSNVPTPVGLMVETNEMLELEILNLFLWCTINITTNGTLNVTNMAKVRRF
jgi:hypothetical protein